MGGFKLYTNLTGTIILTASRTGFDNLPAMRNVTVNDALTQPTFYLPPLNDTIANGQFENGDLSGWNVAGEVTPTITTTAHTGRYAVQLGGGSGNLPSATSAHSTLSQTLTWSDSTTATLSMLYRAAVMNPMSTTLTVNLDGPAETLTMTLLTDTEWQHLWWDVPTSFAPTVTVSIDLQTTDSAAASTVVVDEISLGPAVVGSYSVFLPVIAR